MHITYPRRSWLGAATLAAAAAMTQSSWGSLTVTGQSYTASVYTFYTYYRAPNGDGRVITQSAGMYDMSQPPVTYDMIGFDPTHTTSPQVNVTDAASARAMVTQSSSNIAVRLQTHASRVVNSSVGTGEYSSLQNGVFAQIRSETTFSLATGSQVQLTHNRSTYVGSGALNAFPYGLNAILRNVDNPQVSWEFNALAQTGTAQSRSVFMPAGNYSLWVSTGQLHGPFDMNSILPGSMDMTIDFSMTIVPSPSALAFTGLAGAWSMRRRRCARGLVPR